MTSGRRSPLLAPADTKLLSEALRPPQGYELDRLVATTYSLDLVSLLSIPLAFTSFAVDEGDGSGVLSDPLLLLEGLRRHGERITVFCQPGGIAVPLAARSLYVYLEQSVIPVTVPAEAGVFHPKLWVVSYAAPGEAPLLRVLCMSRNLTGDRSRDTLLAIVGSPSRGAPRSSRPLAEFLDWLAVQAGQAGSGREADVRELGAQVRSTFFAPPDGFTGIAFHPLGIPGHTSDPFAGRRDRVLAISPFLGAGRLRQLTDGAAGSILVSRPEEIAAIDPATRARFAQTLVLNEVIEPELADDEILTSEPLPGGELRGLHAKLYVADAGWDARLWTGSANATSAAFERNVEFMVELTGKKSVCGVRRVLGQWDEASLRSLLVPFEPPEETVPLHDDAAWELRRVAAALASAPIRAQVLPRTDTYDVELRTTERWKPPWPAGASVRCWPITLAPGAFATPLDTSRTYLARFVHLPITALTTFYGVEVRLNQSPGAATGRFVASWPLDGEPEGRVGAVLLSLLDNRERVLAFFRLMLAEPAVTDDPGAAARVSLGLDGEGDELAWSAASEPLFEALVRTLEADPTRLDAIERVITELNASEEGATRIPDRFLEIWEPIWEVRQRMGPRR
jgi:hypothetical protein